jgi:nucleotide-binding universal stress UspA family protein
MLHHDLRAPLVYSCTNCLHEWQLDAEGQPPQAAKEPPQEDKNTESPISVATVVPAENQPGSPARASPFRRIAVCVDGSEMSETLVLHAAKVAAVFGVPLTILRVLETEPHAGATPAGPLDWDVRQREARAQLERLAALVGHRDLDVQSDLIVGRAAEQICCWVFQHGADLTVLGSHGEHGRSEWTLSSTARKLVDLVPGSLLLIPAGGDGNEGVVWYRRIMVPLDGSPRAERVLPIATRLAAINGADLLIAHVTPAPELTKVGLLTAQDLELERRVIARNERVARDYLLQICARVSKAGLAARTVISHGGDARRGLARLVRREEVDLIILSAYGRRGPRDTPCGSVAAHLLTHVATPLLVVRERPRRVLKRLSQEAARRAASAPGHIQAYPPAIR